jgi:D-3-phosphoglycerate dehydrogenase
VSTTGFKVAITNPYVKPHDIENEILGGIARLVTTDRQITTEDELLTFAGDCHALLLGATEPLTKRVIERMPNLKIISRYGVGVDNVDLKTATGRGVMVTNVPDYGIDEVADHAFTMMLAITRKLTIIDRAVKHGEWLDGVQGKMKPLNSPSSQVLGLLGFGNIARRVVLRARPFGYKVIAYDPWVKRWDFAFLGVERVTSLDELLVRSDAISIHVSLGPESKHMLGEKQLKMMKRTACIINTSRGPVIDQSALVRALRGGTIAGAALDVYETEPLPRDDPLRKLENTILTPHISWYTEQSQARLKTEAARAVADALTGRKPEFLVNPEVAK